MIQGRGVPVPRKFWNIVQKLVSIAKPKLLPLGQTENRAKNTRIAQRDSRLFGVRQRINCAGIIRSGLPERLCSTCATEQYRVCEEVTSHYVVQMEGRNGAARCTFSLRHREGAKRLQVGEQTLGGCS